MKKKTYTYYIHPMEYYQQIQECQLLIHAMQWKNLENTAKQNNQKEISLYSNYVKYSNYTNLYR